MVVNGANEISPKLSNFFGKMFPCILFIVQNYVCIVRVFKYRNIDSDRSGILIHFWDYTKYRYIAESARALSNDNFLSPLHELIIFLSTRCTRRMGPTVLFIGYYEPGQPPCR